MSVRPRLLLSESIAKCGTVAQQPFHRTFSPVNIATRALGTNRKAIDEKNNKRLRIQAKKKKNTGNLSSTKAAEEDTSSSKDNQPFLQHQEWVKFQQSITVDGFQTGQVTSASVLKKSRGGKQARNRREREMARMQEKTSQTSQKLPAIRYSEEETAELLKLAYSSLPEKAGKRGTRNLKRQARRWKLVREIRSKYKYNIQQAHERRMEKRQWKREQTKAVKAAAPETCANDLDYQGQVLRRWAKTMFDDPAVTVTTAEGQSINE